MNKIQKNVTLSACDKILISSMNISVKKLALTYNHLFNPSETLSQQEKLTLYTQDQKLFDNLGIDEKQIGYAALIDKLKKETNTQAKTKIIKLLQNHISESSSPELALNKLAITIPDVFIEKNFDIFKITNGTAFRSLLLQAKKNYPGVINKLEQIVYNMPPPDQIEYILSKPSHINNINLDKFFVRVKAKSLIIALGKHSRIGNHKLYKSIHTSKFNEIKEQFFLEIIQSGKPASPLTNSCLTRFETAMKLWKETKTDLFP